MSERKSEAPAAETSADGTPAAASPDTPLLDVEDLCVEFDTYGGTVQAVRGVSFSVGSGETLAIVGESGCGKSVTVQSLMGLTPMPPGRITSGSARLRGVEILGRTEIDGREIRGREIGMIFQDPMTSLNPTMTIGSQIAETLEVHRGWSRSRAFARAVELLEMARIPEAAERARQYPFEFSGGMLQRAMIAMSIACEPALLIADEPTTALDVTIQAQVLDLMGDLQRDTGMAIVLITHDLGVVARMADEVVVMYAGQVAERGTVDDVFYRSAHPYTLGLRAAMPSNDPDSHERLLPIEGSPPDLFSPPVGCAYGARCPYAMRICSEQDPGPFFQGERHYARCWLHHPTAPAVPELHQSRSPEAAS
jgi:oligopeptide/dipeptide ABC transporter ATP-binding protein